MPALACSTTSVASVFVRRSGNSTGSNVAPPPSTRTEAERAAGLKAARESYWAQAARAAQAKAAAAAHAVSLAPTHQVTEVRHKLKAAASTSAHPAAAAADPPPAPRDKFFLSMQRAHAGVLHAAHLAQMAWQGFQD